MTFSIDQKFLIDCFRDLASVPSPVSYDVHLKAVIERYAAQFGCAVTYDRRRTPYITLLGQDNSKTVLVGAHADTLGLMVRHIDAQGRIFTRALGGINYNNIEGETVTVHTRDGHSYTGMMVCKSHSVHVFLDARTLPRNDESVFVLLDEKIFCREDVLALGIQNGDIISIDPQFEFTDNGFLKCRFIDDKIAIACCFAAVKYLQENGLTPKYRTLLAFPYREEIGQGGRYVPEEVSEYVAIDIGLIGPEHTGNEYAVSICAKDKNGPYDYELTGRLMEQAKKAGADYNVDVFLNYSTDGNAAVRGGCDLIAADFGPAVWCSHGRERTHIDGIVNTVKLLLAYLLDI